MAKAKKKEKLNLELLVLCDYALISKDNKLSILGTFDRIFVNKVPARHAKMFVVGVIRGKPDSKHILKLTIKGPSGKDILPGQELKVNLGSNGRSNLITEVGNLPVPSTGKYLLKISTSSRVLGSRVFSVSQTGGMHAKGKKKEEYPN